MTGVIDGFAMEVLILLKKHYVKWLENMACIRRQTEHMDQLFLAEFEDFARNMATIAIA
jgi:hypothetical protein